MVDQYKQDIWDTFPELRPADGESAAANDAPYDARDIHYRYTARLGIEIADSVPTDFDESCQRANDYEGFIRQEIRKFAQSIGNSISQRSGRGTRIFANVSQTVIAEEDDT